MSAIDPNKCLPPELTVESVDDILYRNGLSSTSLRDRPKRSKIFNPYFILTVFTLIIAKELTIFCLNIENDFILKALGCIGPILGIRIHVLMIYVLLTTLAASSQLIHLFNYKAEVKSSFPSLMQVIAGSIPPICLGLTNQKEILYLIERTRVFVKIGAIYDKFIIMFVCLIFTNGTYLTERSLFDMIVFGLPNSVILSLFGFYLNTLINIELMMFYILCLYLKLKVNALNESLSDMKRRKRFIRIRETLQSFDSLYSEIDEYNTTFWSKFLGVFWLTLGIVIVFLIYMIKFTTMPNIMIILLVISAVFLSAVFLLIILTAASVNYCANKAYKTFNSFIVLYSQHNKHFSYIRRPMKFKLHTFIERVAERRVGFTCWKLFTINYFRCYEILSFLSMLLLKLIETFEY